MLNNLSTLFCVCVVVCMSAGRGNDPISTIFKTASLCRMHTRTNNLIHFNFTCIFHVKEVQIPSVNIPLIQCHFELSITDKHIPIQSDLSL
jgi:hypothetical protein